MPLVAAVVFLLLVAFTHPMGASAAANPGGTAPAGAGTVTPPSSKTTGGTPKASSVASAHGAAIAEVRCVPVNNCSANLRQVSVHGRLLLKGSGLKNGMVVGFPRSGGAHINSRSPSAHLHKSSLGLVVTVPNAAHSGHIAVVLSHGKLSNAYGPVYVVRHALHPPAPKKPAPSTATSLGASTASGTALDGLGMWIWYLNQSSGGSIAAIVAQAHAAGVTTVFVKSSDGPTNYWSQFTAQMVAEMHANGLKVCAWQYVYGSEPTGEANLGAQAVAAGADCLVIDAEAEYEGRYSAAQTYITDLRAKIGLTYPVALASFPYVDYHEAFPYSVFLGPGGAQYNAPQMYWKAIGTSVETVFSHTYLENTIYGRPIFPLGQTYSNPSTVELASFKTYAAAYGASGSSFWDWQETSSTGWSALATPTAPFTGVPPTSTFPLLKEGAKGDQVLWLQEHLATAIPAQQTTGSFASQTLSDLESFQTSHGIPASGETDAATWGALLALTPVAVDWTGGGPQN
jgi:hypothetical protein